MNFMSGTDMWQTAIELSENYKIAVEKSGVKNIVNLSSVGVDNENAGFLYTGHFAEDAPNSLEGVNVAHIRPVGFYNNLFADIQSRVNKLFSAQFQQILLKVGLVQWISQMSLMS